MERNDFSAEEISGNVSGQPSGERSKQSGCRDGIEEEGNMAMVTLAVSMNSGRKDWRRTVRSECTLAT